MRKTKSEKIRAFLTAAAIGLGISLTATVTHAGFQWVPPNGQQPAPPAAAVPSTEVEQTVLPMPPEEPVAVPAQPQLNAGDAAVNAPANAGWPKPQTLQLPPSYNPQPVPTAAQQPQPVLKVRNISPSVPPAEEQITLPMPDEISATPAPVMAEPIVMQPMQTQQAVPVAVPAPVLAPPVASTKVIMPQDAPQNAMDETPNSQRLLINPFPGQNEQQQNAYEAIPQNAPAQAWQPAPADTTNYAVVEGFGSDMPLAIALQQVVPADYAYSFDTSINPGQIVSWDGGKPWNQILTDMLAPHSLEAAVNGKVVHIRPQGAQRQSALTPAQAGDVRRANIKDPGEKSQMQAANTLAGIESAAGDPQPILPAEEKIAAAPAPEQQVAAEQPEQKWNAKAGESLKDILTRWSKEAGVELIWMASYDYQIKNDFAAQDNFTNAVNALVAQSGEPNAAPALQVSASDAKASTASLVIKDKAA